MFIITCIKGNRLSTQFTCRTSDEVKEVLAGIDFDDIVIVTVMFA